MGQNYRHIYFLYLYHNVFTRQRESIDLSIYSLHIVNSGANGEAPRIPERGTGPAIKAAWSRSIPW
jgi:hypothetical protein